MMFMTAKVDKKKIAIIAAAAAAVILLLVILFSGGEDAAPTASTVSSNDARVAFLKGFGWEVSNSPVESGQVRVPEAMSDVYERYNALQKSQGYDLTQYAGKVIMRYVYKINNYPGATDPVYATLLVYKNQIIGGDVTNSAPKGTVSGFSMPKAPDNTVPSTTAPAPVE
jgi:hypothetical protein